MPDLYIPSRPGAANLADSTETDSRTNLLKVYAGEVLAAFLTETKCRDRFLTRKVRGAKSTSFPRIGKVAAKYHIPGTELTGEKVAHQDEIINADALLLSDIFIANIDEMMLHFDTREPYRTEQGNALAIQFDKNVMAQIILGARSASNLTGIAGGATIISDDFKSATLATRMGALFAAIKEAKNIFDLRNIPKKDRYFFMRVQDYNDIIDYSDANRISLSNVDLRGGTGDAGMGHVKGYMGFEFVPHTELPSTEITSGVNPYHYGDFTKTRGFFAHRHSVGSGLWQDLTLESDYIVERQGTILVAKMFSGHKHLRREACIEMKLNALSN